jgi:type II secretory pathway pseudopilin PulG
MKALMQAVVVAALTLPVASFAQSDSHLTRAQVRAELIQLEQAGYHVGDGDNTQYPLNIQAAEARVAAQNAAALGGVPNGSSQTGNRTPAAH